MRTEDACAFKEVNILPEALLISDDIVPAVSFILFNLRIGDFGASVDCGVAAGAGFAETAALGVDCCTGDVTGALGIDCTGVAAVAVGAGVGAGAGAGGGQVYRGSAAGEGEFEG